MKTALICGIIALTVVFALFCFGTWQVNPGVWEPGTRAMCAFFGILSALPAAIFGAIYESEKF